MQGLGSQELCLDDRCKRDSNNAQAAKAAADREIMRIMQRDRPSQLDQVKFSVFKSISKDPFQAMVEVVSETGDKNGATTEQAVLWYAHERTQMTEVLDSGENRVVILPWTHPGVQVALSDPLGIYVDLEISGYKKLLAVKPLARAHFTQVIPELIGLYDPGGKTVVEAEKAAPITGLKAVKLKMLPEQVRAFISRMDGALLVTGAPGSGKTTVALQRIRFLLDQQQEARNLQVSYSAESTRVFLANENLIAYSRNLLVDELEIPSFVVEYVPTFTRNYLELVWQHKCRARPRTRHIHRLEERARRAFWGLCTSRDLKGVWQTFEEQIAFRLNSVREADWNKTSEYAASVPAETLSSLAIAFQAASRKAVGENPLRTEFGMSSVFRKVRQAYENFREGLSLSHRDRFDNLLLQWLFWVYDPIDALKVYFEDKMDAGQGRIRKGTGSRLNDEEVVGLIRKDLEERQYGQEMEPWITWLLRFALPVESVPSERFRLLPSAFMPAQGTPEGRWTHIVIDEAQDLSVPEASLLASLVHPKGALTISADFRQIVSPVHGMMDLSAFRVGSSFPDPDEFEKFPFARNMRQSREIGRFLESFYHSIFGELAPFKTGDRFSDSKPQLLLSEASEFALQIKRIWSVLRKSRDVSTVALVQINEDEVSLSRLRTALENQGVDMASIWSPAGEPGQLITSSAERVKGLEYDACIVVGLDDTEGEVLNFTKNRAYVALSRACRRIVMLCEEFPRSLQMISQDLFQIIQTKS
jgi:hypothetical protein